MANSIARSLLGTGACFVLMSMLSVRTADAAWEIVPAVSLDANYDDNLLLTAGNEQSASKMLLDASASFVNFTERGNIYFQPRVVADSYSDKDAETYETTNYYLNAGGGYNWQTTGWGFRTRYADQRMLRAAFAALAPEDPDIDPGDEFVDPDTGRLEFRNETRETRDFRTNYDIRTSQRDSFRFDLRHQDVNYSAKGTSGWSDYNNDSLGIEYSRQLAQRSNVSIALIASEFNADRDNNSSDSVGIQARYIRPLSQTWTLNLNLGYARSDYDFLSGGTRVQDDSTNPIFGVSFRKRAERSLWNLDFQHSVQPNGNGFLVQRANVRAYASYNFSPRLVGRFAMLLTATETLDDLRAVDEREFLRAGFDFEWAWRPTLFLTFGLDHLTQDFVNEADREATSNSVFVGLTYRGRSRQ